MNAQILQFDTQKQKHNFNMARRLDEIARDHPELDALVEGSGVHKRIVTYKMLAEKVRHKAAVMHSAGLSFGEIVVILEPLGIDLFTTILAVWRLGATVLMFDPAQKLEVLEEAIGGLRPKAVIASRKGLIVAMALKSVRSIELKLTDTMLIPGWRSIQLRRPYIAPSLREVPPDHIALMTLTSGTSGGLKTIERSHQFLSIQLAAVSSSGAVRSGSRELTSLPVFILANLASQTTTIIPDANLSRLRELSVSGIVQQLEEFRPSRILGSPAFIQKIVRHCRTHDVKLPFIRTIVTGGGPVFPKLLWEIKAVCPFAEIVTVYGSSEAEPISKIEFSALSDYDFDAIASGAGLPVGRPVAEVQLRVDPLIANEDAFTHPEQLATLRYICEIAGVPIDAVGEILVTGEHVVKGYHKGIGDLQSKVSIDGRIWHRTGDVGYLDKRGRLWLTGRQSRVTPGNSVIDSTFAQCVEAAVLCDPSIEKAACLTVDDATTLFLEAGSGKIDSVNLRSRLGWSRLNAVKVVKKIPVDSRHASKVLYHKLISLHRHSV
ncbi:MAG: AMP-binding protein [Candidatus Obscuribacterales bacterium]|nr:AMP-binding protein [Candidatus Obscuribacterales bacterium]